MDTLDQQMGYVLARLEELREDSKEMQRKLTALEARVDEKFKTAEATFRVVKWMSGITVAVLTIPWHNVKAFVLSMFR